MLDQVGELGVHAQYNIHMMERVKIPFRHRLGLEQMIWKGRYLEMSCCLMRNSASRAASSLHRCAALNSASPQRASCPLYCLLGLGRCQECPTNKLDRALQTSAIFRSGVPYQFRQLQ